MDIGSKSKLSVVLSGILGPDKGKVSLEQYMTDSEIAASVLWDAFIKDGLKGRIIADLGCGTGILGLGALLLGAKKVYFIDVDKDSMGVCKKNHEMLKSEGFKLGKADFIVGDIADFNTEVDLVVMNPPFGTKKKHADRDFLLRAMAISKLIYSFHKSETSGFVDAVARDCGFKVMERMDFSFPLKASYAFHRRQIHRIKVSCFVLAKTKADSFHS